MSTEMPLATVTVSATTYPGTAQVISAVAITGFSFVNEDGTDIVFASFDGTNDHAIVYPSYNAPAGSPGPAANYGTTKQSVWFRLATATATAKVRVMGSGT
jgi:hypothetical protein